MWKNLRSGELCLLLLRTVIDAVHTHGGKFYISSTRMTDPVPYYGKSCSYLSLSLSVYSLIPKVSLRVELTVSVRHLFELRTAILVLFAD
jgi:hypothetical protein